MMPAFPCESLGAAWAVPTGNRSGYSSTWASTARSSRWIWKAHAAPTDHGGHAIVPRLVSVRAIMVFPRGRAHQSGRRVDVRPGAGGADARDRRLRLLRSRLLRFRSRTASSGKALTACRWKASSPIRSISSPADALSAGGAAARRARRPTVSAGARFSQLPVGLGGNQGYAVLRPNYRGSAGYGNRSYRDRLAAISTTVTWTCQPASDQVIAMGVADPDRLAMTG